MPTPPVPSPPPGPIQKILGIVENLVAALEDEIVLLDKREYKRHPALLRQKQELTMHYQTLLKELKTHPEKEKLLAEGGRATLDIAGKKLEEVVQRNAQALRVAQAVSERLMTTVMEDVRQQMQSDTGYSRQALTIAAMQGAVRPAVFSQRV